MGYTEITTIYPPVYQGQQVWISWSSSQPAGTWYQVYFNETFVWFGQKLGLWLPQPPELSRLDVGWVLPGEEQTDFASSLPSAPERRALLQWFGGTFESPDLAGFTVYGEVTPGGGIVYTAPLATITAYPSGIITDGWGMGGWGGGGWGHASSSYAWTSDTLTSGTWHFAVVPFDSAGNQGTGATVAITITCPPLEPGSFSDGTRLHYTYNATNHEATLNWNVSP